MNQLAIYVMHKKYEQPSKIYMLNKSISRFLYYIKFSTI